MKFTDDFRLFLRDHVNLNVTRLHSLQERVDAVERFIADSEEFKACFVDMLPAGSWSQRTIIKPVRDHDTFDADVLVMLDPVAGWEAKDYVEKLYATFRASGRYKALARRKTRCARLDYAGEFHIDLVPYMERHGGTFITNREDPPDTGAFERSSPEAFSAWVDERERFTEGSFVKVVRLVKYLRDFKDTFSCKSIILTTLLGNQVNAIECATYPERYRDVPSCFVTLLGKLAASLPASMPPVMDPAGTGDNFTDRYRDSWNYENFKSRITFYAEKARAALEENEDRGRSIALWREIFGDAFKKTAKIASLTEDALRASVPYADEQFIEREPFNQPMALQPNYALRVTGRCTRVTEGNRLHRRAFRPFDLPKRGNRVPKNRELLFTIETDVPRPCEVFWKVRNGGEEARADGGLRGEITRDDGSEQKTETTKYTGKHYVECYIVKNGQVVAKDRQVVIVTT